MRFAMSLPMTEEWRYWFPDRGESEVDARGIRVTAGRDAEMVAKEGEPPLLFETMVFGAVLGYAQSRCSTYAEAESQHAQMVQRVKEAGK